MKLLGSIMICQLVLVSKSFFVSQNLAASIISCVISPCCFSDHDFVNLLFSCDNLVRCYRNLIILFLPTVIFAVLFLIVFLIYLALLIRFVQRLVGFL